MDETSKGISKGGKIAIIVASSVVGVMMIGGACAALAVGAVYHLREEHGRAWGKWTSGGDECDRYKGRDGFTGVSGGVSPQPYRNELGQYCEEALGDLAGTLGLSAADLKGELAGGRNIMDIAGEKGVSLDRMVESVTRVAGEIIDREVAQGDLSPALASAIKDDVASDAPWILEHGAAWLQLEYTRQH
jgi:hypothetical protein